MEGLEQVFLDFTSFGAGQAGSSEMDSAKFAKLAKDCKLTGKRLSATDLDLIFTKVKGKNTNKINYDTFVEAISLIAEKSGKSTEEVATAIVSAKGPKTGAATVADDVRFHDDKSTFTGVHNRSGASQVDNHRVDMSRQLGRSGGGDVRGVMAYQDDVDVQKKRGSLPSSPSRRISQEGAKGTSAEIKPKSSPRRSSSTSPSNSVGAAAHSPAGGMLKAEANGETADLEKRVADVFIAFSSSVAKASVDMDSSKFFKLMGDAGLTGKSLSRTDCDLIFTKTCSTAGCVKKINFTAFRKVAIPFLAAHLSAEEGSLLSKVACVQGISSSGTVAQATRFHDDKSTYTGSHVAGGPTHKDNRVTLDSLADRSSADVRGVQAGRHEGGSPKQRYSTESYDSVDDYVRRRSSGSVACPSAVVAPMPAGVDVAAAASTLASRGSPGASPTSPSRRKSSLAEAGGTIAGSANKKGGVYDRLCDQKTYTGVYAERFKGGGGRINGDTVNDGVSFSGNTNSGGDQAVRDLSQICNRR